LLLDYLQNKLYNFKLSFAETNITDRL